MDMSVTNSDNESALLALAVEIHASHQEIHSQIDAAGRRQMSYDITVDDVVDSIIRMHAALPDESEQFAELDKRVETIFNFLRFNHDLEKLQNEILQRLGFA